MLTWCNYDWRGGIRKYRTSCRSYPQLITKQQLSNLCSGFSYVLTILGSIYVWHGRGSIDSEKTGAIKYAKSMMTPELTLTELHEGEEDEMFWMVRIISWLIIDSDRAFRYWGMILWAPITGNLETNNELAIPVFLKFPSNRRIMWAHINLQPIRFWRI